LITWQLERQGTLARLMAQRSWTELFFLDEALR